MAGPAPSPLADWTRLMRRAFTRRLTRLVQVRVADGAGGYTSTWEARGGIWADVKAGSGSARVTELGEEPRLRVRILTPAVPQGHDARVEPGNRLQEGTRLFEVEAVHEADQTGRVLVLFSREITEGGAV